MSATKERSVARTADGEWVSTVSGDRSCVSCGFNLYGQPVVKEPTYGLFIVRCPECATAAALQEYPSMGRWARRVGALLAALWLLIVVGGSFAMGGALTGFTMLTVSAAATPLEREIDRTYRAWEAEQRAGSAQVAPFYSSGVDDKWWSQQDPGALLDASGGTARAWRGAVGAAPALLIPGFIFGMLIAVLAMHQRGWRLALAALVPVTIAAAFTSIAVLGEPDGYWSGELARHELGLLVAPAALLVAWLAMVAGTQAGRPVARFIVRLMLPPTLIAPLVGLWLCDGMAPPRPRRRG